MCLDIAVRRVAIGLLLIRLGTGACTLAEDKGAAPQIKVGVFCEKDPSWFAEWKRRGFYRELQKRGMTGGMVDHRPFFYGKYSAERIYKRMKPFHVILYERTVWGGDPKMRDVKAYRQAMRKYLEQGGGILVLADLGEYWVDYTYKSFNDLFMPFGAIMLTEAVNDPEREYRDTTCKALRILGPNGKKYESFFYTTNITKHPATTGIKGLFLPQYGHGGMWGTVAIKYNSDWTVLIRGMKSAKSFRRPANWAGNKCGPFTDVGAYRSEPPIAAARSWQQGRMIIYSCNSMHVTENYGVNIWHHVHEWKGDPGTRRPSNGLDFIAGSLLWLAEPALVNKELGGYLDQPVKPVQYARRVDWSRGVKSMPDNSCKRVRAAGTPPVVKNGDFRIPAHEQQCGLIGIHTGLSDGKGTVAEWAAAARSSGLRFLVFTESFERMNAEKFKQLKRECAKAGASDFYACPGMEISDMHGLRWAFWGESVLWPTPELLTRDGKRLRAWGGYAAHCGRRPNALLNYDRIAEIGGDPANMWWFFRIPAFVYSDNRLLASNLDQVLFALADLRLFSTIIYSRLHSPGQISIAVDKELTCIMPAVGVPGIRDWLNARCSSRANYAYATQGPRIRLFRIINSQMEHAPARTVGAQRVPVHVAAASAVGIAEVVIHDQDRGVLRRFLVHGKKEFVREFELVHDKQRALAMVVKDVDGRRAIMGGANEYRLYCYKAGLYRCGDNLNMLGSAAILTHPDRHQFPTFKSIEGTSGVHGVDWGTAVLTQPDNRFVYSIRTASGSQPGGMMNRMLRMPFVSDQISLMQMSSTHVTNYQRSLTPPPAKGCLLVRRRPLPFADFSMKAYVLQSRMDYFTAWNHRRVYDGARPYKGGVIIHDQIIRFKRKVRLDDAVPIKLQYAFAAFGAADHLWNQVFVADRVRGVIARTVRPGEKLSMHGILRAGGYVCAMPTDAGTYAFLAGRDAPMRYWVSGRGSAGQVGIGLGEHGREFAAGETLRVRYMNISLPAKHAQSNELLEHLSRIFNLAGGSSGYPVQMEVGSLIDAYIFLTVVADRNEVLFTAGPVRSIVDMPVRVKGVEDNGCAAVYVTNGRGPAKRYRFIAVNQGTAWFQQAFEEGPRMWVGNVFVAEHKALRLTLVADGQGAKEEPFLEIHNPTTQPITCRVWSPAHAPMFGGISATVMVPAGDSVFAGITGRRLVMP